MAIERFDSKNIRTFQEEATEALREVALKHGVPRIGVNQRGDSRFIHLDIDSSLQTPTIWSY